MRSMRSAFWMIRRHVLTGASVAGRVGGRVVRQLMDHPFTIDRVDASADALWPRNPEEADSPRWRFDALGRSARSAVPDEGPCACPVRSSRLVSQGR
jgi:hypothetical protein